ncbi:hypothetical protein L0F63_006292, partial [Massospora cicadina]
MSAQLYKTRSGRLFHAGAIALITVGLPARGKTHICRSLRRYLNWVGVKTEVFHVGDYRRKLVGPEPNDFFDPANKATAAIRATIVQAALRDMTAWFQKGGQVGILDATNTLRVEEVTKIVYYLMNLHITRRAIYFVKEDSLISNPRLSEEGLRYARALKDVILNRHNENTRAGQRNRDLKIWTSTGASSVQTGKEFLESFENKDSLISEVPHEATPPESVLLQPRKALVQMDAGVCRGLTQEEIQTKYPEEVAEREKNLYRHRFPRAESYLDLAVRLESIIMELEREKDDVVIIAHESETEIPFLRFGYDNIVEVVPSAYGSKETLLPSG